MAQASLTIQPSTQPLTYKAASAKSPDWPIADRMEVIRLTNAGKSLTFIADKFNRTRGSVAGLIHRARRKGLIPIKAVQSKYVKDKVAKATPQPTFRPRVVATKGRIRLRLIESNTEVTMQELEAHHCRWPIGDPRQTDFRFCGCRKLDGKPYCEKHTLSAGRLYISKALR